MYVRTTGESIWIRLQCGSRVYLFWFITEILLSSSSCSVSIFPIILTRKWNQQFLLFPSLSPAKQMLCPIQAILSLPVKTRLCCHSAVGNMDFLSSALWAGAASKQTLSSSIPACFPPHFVHRMPWCWTSASQSHSHGRDHANQQCHAVFWCQCPAFTWWGLKCVYSYCCYGVRSFTVSLILERLHLVSANTPWNFCLSLDINSSFFSKFKTLWTSEQHWTQGQVWLPFSTWEPLLIVFF